MSSILFVDTDQPVEVLEAKPLNYNTDANSEQLNSLVVNASDSEHFLTHDNDESVLYKILAALQTNTRLLQTLTQDMNEVKSSIRSLATRVQSLESTKPDDSLIQQIDAPVGINLFQQTDAPVNVIEEEAAYEDEAINNVTTFFPLKNTRDVYKFVEFLETDPENIRAFHLLLHGIAPLLPIDQRFKEMLRVIFCYSITRFYTWLGFGKKEAMQDLLPVTEVVAYLKTIVYIEDVNEEIHFREQINEWGKVWVNTARDDLARKAKGGNPQKPKSKRTASKTTLSKKDPMAARKNRRTFTAPHSSRILSLKRSRLTNPAPVAVNDSNRRNHSLNKEHHPSVTPLTRFTLLPSGKAYEGNVISRRRNDLEFKIEL